MVVPIHIAVTGGAGHIAYSLLFRLARGELFPGQTIVLHLLEVPEKLSELEGVAMELQDCAFPLLQDVVCGSDPYKVFENVDVAFLVGAKPRGPGMERKDLLSQNGALFITQGKALSTSASKNVKVAVIGNPCNTNCLIALHHAKDIPRENFFAMTRLDQNRAAALLAKKAQVSVNDVQQVIIWGNHSSTQVPDWEHAQIRKQNVQKYIQDKDWLETEFFRSVQQRGAEIIKVRGKSSAASAASAALDMMRDIISVNQEENSWYSAGIYAQNNPYGIDEDLVFSFPCKTTSSGIEIISDLHWSSVLEEKIKVSEKELLEERDLIRDLLR